jgi:hypothetical protein
MPRGKGTHAESQCHCIVLACINGTCSWFEVKNKCIYEYIYTLTTCIRLDASVVLFVFSPTLDYTVFDPTLDIQRTFLVHVFKGVIVRTPNFGRRKEV